MAMLFLSAAETFLSKRPSQLEPQRSGEARRQHFFSLELVAWFVVVAEEQICPLRSPALPLVAVKPSRNFRAEDAPMAMDGRVDMISGAASKKPFGTQCEKLPGTA